MKTVICMLCSLLLLFCIVPSASAAQLIAATSDYESGNTAVYDTETAVFVPAALGQDDQDVMVDTDGEYLYFLSRSLGSISKYVAAEVGTDIPEKGFIWEFSVGPASNPCDIVFLDTKAYVIRYGSDEILVIDHNATDSGWLVSGTIDIAAYDDVDVPEAIHGFAAGGMVYIVLQRLNGWDADRPGYLLKIDPATDTLVDLDPGTEGVQGRELLVRNPQYFSQHGDVAYIGGHVFGEQTEGVQSVDLAGPDLAQTMLLDEEEMGMDVTGVAVFDDSRAIFYSSSWGQEGDDWIQIASAYWFDPATGETGDALPVPTPDGGAVASGGIAYIGSRDNDAPGIYPVDMATNTLAGPMLATTLPPVALVIAGDETPAAVADELSAPESFALNAPYPNPFNPATTVSFTAMTDGMARVDVVNITGQVVDTLMQRHVAAGQHAVKWRPDGIANGVYFVRVNHAGTVKTAKVSLVK